MSHYRVRARASRKGFLSTSGHPACMYINYVRARKKEIMFIALYNLWKIYYIPHNYIKTMRVNRKL